MAPKKVTNVGITILPDMLEGRLIAPCGINCCLCVGYVREKKRCPGCNSIDTATANHRLTCRLKHCAERAENAERACYDCTKFPCLRLRQLDKRYRTRYRVSVIENLEYIRDQGIDVFIEREKVRWACPGCGTVISMHRPECIHCGRPRV